MQHRYLVALGSNVPHHRHGRPEAVLRAALDALGGEGVAVEAVSPVWRTRPLGPSLRRFANAVAVVRARFAPDELLEYLRAIEDRFGRKRGGQRWAARVLDLDIVLWDGGMFADDALVIPHPHFRSRNFVLRPALAIAADWRDPLTGLTIRHLHARLTRSRQVPN